MAKSKKKTTILALAIILVIAIFFVSNSYSRYRSSKSGAGSISVAKWKIKLNNEVVTSSQTISLEDTLTSNNYSTSKVIPGTNGEIDLVIDLSETEVKTDYTISLDNTSNIPSNLKLYTDNTYTTELTNIVGSYELTGTGINTHKLYWRWNFTSSDESNWMNSNIYIKLNLVAEQRIGGGV